MAWTHPFEDGNGRAVRLQTHCALHLISGGLWSANRGLARHRDRYYEMLDNADSARHGDLDGRGNLSEKMLWAWCRYFLALCEDQVDFMTSMLDLPKLKDRIRAYLLVRGATDGITEYREEALLPLHTVAGIGSVSRGDFIRMTGLEERTARKVISRFIKDGLLTSVSGGGNRSLGVKDQGGTVEHRTALKPRAPIPAFPQRGRSNTGASPGRVSRA
jgi:Fic family protein